MQRKSDQGEMVFVVETCQNCKEHHWNTRHDETKYEDFYHKISSAIISRLPNAVVLRNQIPKAYLPYDLYVNLIPNEDENCPIYDQVPRTGSFEVSYKGMLIFSKLQSGYWPNTQLVGEKCYLLVKDESENKDLKKYFAGNSPTKVGGVKQSQVSRGNKNQMSKSPVRNLDTTPTGGFSQSLRSGGSPTKSEAIKFNQVQQPGSILQQQKQQQQEQFKPHQQEIKQVPQQQQPKFQEQKEDVQQKQPISKQPSERGPKFIDTTQPIKSTVPVQQPVAQQQQQQQQQQLQQQPKQQQSEQNKEQVVVQQEEPVQKQDSHKYSDNYEDEFEDKGIEEPTEIEPEKVQEPETIKDQEVGPHLKSVDDLTDGFPIFPPGTNSLLSQNLTREIWDELKDQVDDEGFTFKQAIFKGCCTDSNAGVFAGSQSSYYKFGSLFDNIVEQYHQFDKSQNHQSDLDYTKLQTPLFSEDEAAMIKSTRIRVARNLADFPLGPLVTREQRNDIEAKIVQALSKFQGDLEGRYYSLSSSLSENEKKQLIDDHNLFKEEDKYQEAGGLNRDWPEGRGIFFNFNQTFSVWVNEEDQVRMISMQQDDDVRVVFKRLSQAIDQIEQVLKFAYDDHLGYITSCPSNLGTTIRASMLIYLPYLGKNKQEFEQLVDKYNLQIRGSNGEHTESIDHIYDVSNKRRLGLSEVQCVQDMYNGVKALIKREKELAPKEQQFDKQAGSYLKKPQDINGFPLFPEGTHSLLSKYLTRDIWNELKYKRDEYGFSFRQAILSGTQNTDSGIGVYAGSHNSYTAFASLFDQIIQDYHQHSKDAKHVSDMDYTHLHAPPFPDDDAKMIKSTRIRVGRNLKGYPLGPGLSDQQRQEIEEKVVKALSTFQGDLEGKYYALSNLTDNERKQLIDDHFLFKEGDRFLEACGLNRNWPNNRGIFHNNEKTFLVWVNEEDQLRIISMQQGADLGAVFTRLSKACAHIQTVADFSHDEHLGYITSCPTNLGTALRASVHIELPLLGNRKSEFESIANKYYVQIRGIHGEHSETADHVYDISNKRRLGRSEVQLVQDMYNGVQAMIHKEKELRQQKIDEIKLQQEKEEQLRQEEQNKKQQLIQEELLQKQKEAEEQLQFERSIQKQEENEQQKIQDDIVQEDVKSQHSSVKVHNEEHQKVVTQQEQQAEQQSQHNEDDIKSVRSETQLNKQISEKQISHAVSEKQLELNQSIASLKQLSVKNDEDVQSQHHSVQHNEEIKDDISVKTEKKAEQFRQSLENDIVETKSIKSSTSHHQLENNQTEIHNEVQQSSTQIHPAEHNIAIEEIQHEVHCGSQLKSYTELTGFPVFPEGTKSLLSKYLTKEIWDKLHDAKDLHSFTFKEAIFSGCQNVDSGIGVYAGSHDSYKAFEDLFDKIIKDYHGHNKEDKHVSDMETTKLECPPLEDDEASMIVSTRIRVGRNLADFPLGPALTKEQRQTVEKTVSKALEAFDGDLKGTYYSLESLDEQTRQQLIADHFLFKEGDRFLEACGLNRDWPEGRGIFHNEAKTFLVWVNEEDQLRIISMQQGSNIFEVFERLSRACKLIENEAKFAHDEHLGYITSCPTNLGTALRASVHIKLPKLGQKQEEFKEIADKYHVQIRGIHGEHSESADHIYDISNKRRLGLSEAQLVQDMYNGVKALIQKEKELQ